MVTTIIEQLPKGWTRESRAQRVQEIALHKFNSRVIHKSGGEPYLESCSNTNISISHTADFLALSFSMKKRCGVDIELISRRTKHLSRRFASSTEVEIAQNIFPDNPSLLIWCAKEAMYKFLGREGVDFLKELEVTSATPTTLNGYAYGEVIEMEWSVSKEHNLLTVNVI